MWREGRWLHYGGLDELIYEEKGYQHASNGIDNNFDLYRSMGDLGDNGNC